MSEDEAKKLAAVFATADGGCPCCVGSICGNANTQLLGWHWVMTGEYPATVEARRGDNPKVETRP